MSKTPTGENDNYDLAVIGAGSAGFSAAITASEGGKRVALIGHGVIGGTCVNVGCVPSKTMIRAAEAIYAARAAARFAGLSATARVDDWGAVVTAKDELVSQLREKKYLDLLPGYKKIDYIDEGPARLVEGGVKIGDRVVSAPRIIIASGARPLLPEIDGIKEIDTLDSTGVLALPTLPESLIFIGAGYIGAELALMMARFGVKVTLVCRSRLLPEAEPEVSELLAHEFRAQGVGVYCALSYKECKKDQNGVLLVVEKAGKTVELKAQRLVVTAGRRANSENMGLAEAGVKLNGRGAVVVGDDMLTSKPGIYAAGDVTGRDQFVYMAAYGAKLAARNAVLGQNDRYDNAAMPWVVFTDPQVAGVGLSEAGAIAAGYEVKTSVLALDQVPRALAARDTRGLIKLVADKKTDRLLGGQIVAPEGADAVQTLVMALKFSMTTKELGETIFPYLTTVEGLKLAAQTFEMDVARLSCCAG